MKIVTVDVDNFNPQPMRFFVDGESAGELYYLPFLDGYFGVLECPDRYMGYNPEPIVSSYTVSLLKAVKMGASLSVISDQRSGKVYVICIDKIMEHGSLRDSGLQRKILVPLRLWDVLLDASASDVQVPRPGGVA